MDESTAGDVPRLCGLALNAYLVMLLEIGTLVSMDTDFGLLPCIFFFFGFWFWKLIRFCCHGLYMEIQHCDPHPGNLMRTEDGKLCILDHGMVSLCMVYMLKVLSF